jgi:hypothetical protein
MRLWSSKAIQETEAQSWLVYSAFRMALIVQWKPFPMFGLLREARRKDDGAWSHDDYYGYFFNLRRRPLFGYFHDYYDGDLYTLGLGWIQFSWQDHWVMP